MLYTPPPKRCPCAKLQCLTSFAGGCLPFSGVWCFVFNLPFLPASRRLLRSIPSCGVCTPLCPNPPAPCYLIFGTWPGKGFAGVELMSSRKNSRGRSATFRANRFLPVAQCGSVPELALLLYFCSIFSNPHLALLPQAQAIGNVILSRRPAVSIYSFSFSHRCLSADRAAAAAATN